MYQLRLNKFTKSLCFCQHIFNRFTHNFVRFIFLEWIRAIFPFRFFVVDIFHMYNVIQLPYNLDKKCFVMSPMKWSRSSQVLKLQTTLQCSFCIYVLLRCLLNIRVLLQKLVVFVIHFRGRVILAFTHFRRGSQRVLAFITHFWRRGRGKRRRR